MTLVEQGIYTWKGFVEAVEGMLTIDAGRAGIDGYRKAMIRQGVIQLQRLFDEYRIGHEDVYHASDFVTEGKASRGVKPPQSAIRDMYVAAVLPDCNGEGPRCARYPVAPWPWEDRMSLVYGNPCVNDGRAAVAIDPQGYTFYVYPEVFDCWMVSLFWDGLKLDFDEEEETPFDEAMAGAVAWFVKAQVAREVEKDIALHDSYLRSFELAKPKLFTAIREKRDVRSVGEGGGSMWAYGQSGPAPCPSGAGSGAGGIPTPTPTLTVIPQQVYFSNGDPNGVVLVNTTLPCVAIDVLNHILWTKTDGIISNSGWGGP